MANYAEELALWYLRLNGFFPISRFVLHDFEPDKTSDCDLLAVRFPYVHETVGGQDEDWDSSLFKILNPESAILAIGLIVEVKGGNTRYPGNAFSLTRLRPSVERLGFFSTDDAFRLSKQLRSNHLIIDGQYCVSKLFISEAYEGKPEIQNKRIAVSTNHIRKFIRRRCKKYDQKRRDWSFFSSEMMQDIIMRAPKKPKGAPR